MIINILLLTSIVLLLIYYQLTKYYDYWKKRGVKSVEPNFIFGNFWDFFTLRKDRIKFHQEIYNAGAGERYIGIIQIRAPGLYVRDPELLRYILGKDFSHFHDRGIPFDEKIDKLSAHLFNLEGARWRSLRTKLSPTFTSGKIKNMLPFIEQCAQEMVNLLGPHAEREDVIEMREILARYTTDVIGTCAFGVQCNSLKNPDAEFRKMGSMLFNPPKLAVMYQVLTTGLPFLAQILPQPAAFKKALNFLYDAIHETVKYRNDNNIQRNDFLDLLIQIKKKGTIVSNPEELKNNEFIRGMAGMKIEDFEFTDTLMAAQAFVFFVAGFETSSTALSYALIELSKNTEIQEKLRDEIDATIQRHGNKFTYEAIMEMPYLDKVVSETLRMYPPVPFLLRKVTAPYKVPDSDLVLEKDLAIFVPVHAIHHDPKYYPDPETFEPERFSEEEKAKRHNYSYLPFGEGPRNCIGMRFGLLQVKLGLATLLHNYQFELSPDMPYPPIISKSTFLMATDHGTLLKIKKRA